LRRVVANLTVVLLAVLVAAGCSSSHAAVGGSARAGGAVALWPRPADTAAAIKAAGLVGLPAEGNVEHYHAHLDVVVDGSSVVVPAATGIDLENARISPIHTHDTTGVIHIESPTAATYTLGQFFAEWQVQLSATCIADLCSGADRQMVVTVNGKPFAGDPASIVLAAHQQISIWSGKPGTQPPLPASYDFPPGL
jgi:hypothetical protein